MSSWRRWRQSETPRLENARSKAGHRGGPHAPPGGVAARVDSCPHGADSGEARQRLPPSRITEAGSSTWNMDVLPGELQALPTGQLEALPALDFNAIVQPQTVEGQTDPAAIPA